MKTIVRDVLIIFVLTFIGGFIVGISLGANGIKGTSGLIAIGLANILLSAVGFCISGALAKTDRFKHLFKVAIALWLASTINLIWMESNIVQWASSIIPILIAMGIGGGTSYIFASDPKPAAPESA